MASKLGHDVWFQIVSNELEEADIFFLDASYPGLDAGVEGVYGDL